MKRRDLCRQKMHRPRSIDLSLKERTRIRQINRTLTEETVLSVQSVLQCFAINLLPPDFKSQHEYVAPQSV